ncbi:unnamed protein product, partial [Adineta steineri]
MDSCFNLDYQLQYANPYEVNKILSAWIGQIEELVAHSLKELQIVHETEAAATSTTTDTSAFARNNVYLKNSFKTVSIDPFETEILNRLNNDLKEKVVSIIPSPKSTSDAEHTKEAKARSLEEKTCFEYLENFLVHYHYNPGIRKFTASLTVADLLPFYRDLKGLRESCTAFPAAFLGEEDEVRVFVKNYPQYVDLPGPFRTTLLYSAARSGFGDVVKYLVEEAHCSINAQNQQHIDRALGQWDIDVIPFPSAGSTALHGAAYYEQHDVVKYLVERGADYYMKNQADETPIENSLKSKKKINKYFEDYLIRGYFINKPLSCIAKRPAKSMADAQ